MTETFLAKLLFLYILVQFCVNAQEEPSMNGVLCRLVF